MTGPGAITSARRRFGVDPRLLVGLGLVVASVAGVVGIVAAGDTSTPVYAAASPLAPGDRVTADDLVIRSVVLDGAGQFYVSAGDIPDGGLVVIRPVSDGELLPVSSVGEWSKADRGALVIEVPGRVSADVRPGAAIDIWGATPNTDDGAATAERESPTVLVSDALVVRVLDDDDLVAATETVEVEVLVDRERLPRLLQAITDGQTLSMVPADPSRGSMS